ncbi:MAG: SIS domain-containing protein [Acidobacteria bacterium]|nr:SIS domain-containing protein [Acidobacteriota bacterium]
MEKIVFTNGCFDLIHSGHIALLEQARALGTKLIVGINGDDSVRSIKGPKRPVIGEADRAALLMGLTSVDEVRIFHEATPETLIRQISPDVLVKGGDWELSEIVGADFVKENGGEVVTIPLKEGISSSLIIDRIVDSEGAIAANERENSDEFGSIRQALSDHVGVFRQLSEHHTGAIEKCADLIVDAFQNGRKVLICGNGGSAADAQHIAAEFIGRYETERRSLPSVALTTDTSALTALSNDYSFESVFSRQVEGLANKGDVLIAISTSGNSPNILKAIMTARKIGCTVIGLTSGKGRKMAALCDACVLVPGEKTSRIQEAHIAIAHIWCERVDREFTTD